MAEKPFRNPFRGVTDFFSEMNRMNDEMYGRTEHKPRTPATAWAPLTDILARGDDLVVRCEVPGVAREDIDVTFSNGVLAISGVRHTGDGETSWGYYVRERYYGAFRRAISLPEGVGDDDIEAAFDNGLLVVTVKGGATAAEPKRIQVDKGGA